VIALQPPKHEDIQLTGYAMAYAIGLLSQLFRLLSQTPRKELTLLRLVATAAAAGMASVIAVNILINLFGVQQNLVIGISGVFGWLGGNAIETIAKSAEKKLGVNLLSAAEPTKEAPAPVKEGA